jgi:hypothetical protein
MGGIGRGLVMQVTQFAPVNALATFPCFGLPRQRVSQRSAGARKLSFFSRWVNHGGWAIQPPRRKFFTDRAKASFSDQFFHPKAGSFISLFMRKELALTSIGLNSCASMTSKALAGIFCSI